MMPMLSRIRRLAALTSCKSNLKQIAFAWHMYLDDNERRFYQTVNANALYGGWRGTFFPLEPRVLNKYVSLPQRPDSPDDAKVFRCPADDGSEGLQTYDSLGTSYQTNILLIGQDMIASLPSAQLKNEINKRLKGLTASRAAHPDKLLLIGDYPWGSQWVPHYMPGVPWHKKCCNFSIAFLDGHVDYVEIKKGLFVTEEYNVLPFKELYELAIDVQDAQECEFCAGTE
jgi:hypothetical protein